MNKAELSKKVADEADLGVGQAEKAVQTALDAIADAVATGDTVTLAGFGTFERRERSAREGRNPQTGETIQIAATKVAGFKPAAAFKKAVAGE
ncbi:HU family DNA-binding protein [Nocardioides mangrovicus]|uniref:HU family DNA-binding protein n=1 Tax=Nocardioides mangrovicus TaxID=2478913 RepID=A0A3L8P746_9ACTN|nr:HU family DNA-binding protein [Nocardioides mangrovicus]RLV50817.1 HU family DNA-binding protein [Nocardioides mangrovicus]